MRSIIVNQSLNTVQEEIKKHITAYEHNPSIYNINLLVKNEFIGNVVSEFFWIQKIRPRYYNGPKRAFFGKLEKINDNTTKITGKFKFLPQYKMIFVAMQIIVFTNILIGIFKNLFYHVIWTIIVDLLYTFLFNITSVFCYKVEENEVISFLTNIDTKMEE